MEVAVEEVPGGGHADEEQSSCAKPSKGKGVGKGAPPPPPVGKGAGKGVPPPPPPGVKTTQQKPSGKTVQGNAYPNVLKLRPLFWTTVSAVPDESTWAAGREAPAQIDERLIERLFSVASTPVPAVRPSGGEQSEKKRRRVVRVLDDTTSQKLAIALCRLPPPERLATMVDHFDGFPWGLATSAGAVVALRSAFEENQEVIEQLGQHVGDEDAVLDLPERYLWELDQVPQCGLKLETGALLLCSSELPQWRAELAKVGICCQQLRSSKPLARCLSTSLAVGNLLNRGTQRGDAQGVLLPESLLKLAEVRSNQGAKDEGPGERVTLLDIVARAMLDEEVRRGEAEGQSLRSIDALLRQTQQAAAVGLEEVFAAVPRKLNEATNVERRLSELQDTGPGHKRALTKVRQVCKEAALAGRLADGARAEVDLTMRWACSKVGKTKSEAWFALWADYLRQLSKALTKEASAHRRPQTMKRSPSRAGPVTSVEPSLGMRRARSTEPSLVKRSEGAPVKVFVSADSERMPLGQLSPNVQRTGVLSRTAEKIVK